MQKDGDISFTVFSIVWINAVAFEKNGEVLQEKEPAGAQQRHLLYQRATTGKKKAIENKQRKGE